MILLLAGSQISSAQAPSISSCLDSLDARQIPASERFAWQPKELVAIIGTHRWKHWHQTNCVAYHPNGKSLASGGGDNMVRLWDTATGIEQCVLAGHASEVQAGTRAGDVLAVAFAQDGTTLASAAYGGAVRLWDMAAQPPKQRAVFWPTAGPTHCSPAFRALLELRPHHVIDLVAFSPDGKLLGCAGKNTDGTILSIWDLRGAQPRELPALERADGPLAFAPDGKTLATQYDTGIALWDIAGTSFKLRAIGELADPPGPILTLAFSPDGKTLATGHESSKRLASAPKGDVLLWDLTADKPRVRARLEGFKEDDRFSMVPSVAFSPDGKALAFAGRGRQLQLWDVSQAEPRQRVVLTEGTGEGGSFAFSPDGKTIARCGDGVQCWDITGPEPKSRSQNEFIIFSGVPSSNGKLLATRGKSTKVWDLSEAAPKLSGEIPRGLPLWFEQNDRVLAVRSDERTIQLWNVASDIPQPTEGERQLPQSRNAARLSSDGSLLVTGKGDKQLEIWKWSGNTFNSYGVLTDQLGVTAFSADNRTIATLHGNLMPRFARFEASGRNDNERSIHVWNLSGPEPQQLAILHGQPVSTPSSARPFMVTPLVALAPNGRLVALGDIEGEVQIWDLSAAEPTLRCTLRGHPGGLGIGYGHGPVEFARDGSKLVTAGSEGNLIVWEVPSGKELLKIRLPVMSVTFAADSRHLITSNGNGTVYVLRVDTP